MDPKDGGRAAELRVTARDDGRVLLFPGQFEHVPEANHSRNSNTDTINSNLIQILSRALIRIPVRIAVPIPRLIVRLMRIP